MLQRLRIKNFQAHRKLDIQLDQVTCLVGRSDVGKSAILRAIRWLFTNKPSGDDFITEGADECEVRGLVDSQTVRRVRGKANTYVLGDKTFTAFGNGVPDDVVDLVNVDVSLNFQDQHDPVFWLSASPSEVGKQLNAIVDLESVDTVQQDVAARARKLKSHMEFTEDALETGRKSLLTLDYVPDAQKHVETLDRVTDDVGRLIDGVSFLEELLAESRQHRETRTLADLVGEHYDRIASIHDELAETRSTVSRLGKLVSDGRFQREQLRIAVPDGFDVLEESYSRLSEFRKESTRLRRLVDDHVLTNERIRSLQDELRQAEQDLAKEKRCPTCGQKMPE